jgi:type II secretory pathway component PulC
MGKRHNRRWKAEEKFPAPGKRAEEETPVPVKTDIVAAVKEATAELSRIFQGIQNNNGINNGAIDGLVTRGHAVIKALNDEVNPVQS